MLSRTTLLLGAVSGSVLWVACAPAPPAASDNDPGPRPGQVQEAANSSAESAAGEGWLPAIATETGSPADQLLRRAAQEIARGRYAEGGTWLTQAEELLTAEGRTHRDLPLLRGICLLRGEDPDSGVRILRDELAEGAYPAHAALHLADYFGQERLLGEAVGVLDAGLDREPDRLDLQLARARIWMDLGRYDVAAEHLLQLARAPESPRVLAMAASAERALGRRESALRLLQQLRRDFAEHPWVMQWSPELDQHERSLRMANSGTHDYSERELLAILRASENVVMRVRALRTLAANGSALLPDALEIAKADPRHLVRLEAVRHAFITEPDRVGWLAHGLGDSSPAVRGVAARLASGLRQGEGIRLLTRFLDSESDGYVVRQIHASLVELTGEPSNPLPPGAFDSDVIEQVRVFWRQRWDRRSW